MSGQPPPKPMPARGAMAGIKADLERAKTAGQAYDPQGHGAAWTHNFLNQKPWHPMNFRNQIKKWEAEQRHIKEQKEREQGLAEFNAEQEHIKTMSYLSEQEQQKYKDRQSISFMYAKPPGLDAALAKEQAAAAAKEKAAKEAAEKEAAAAAAAAAAANAGALTAGPAQQLVQASQRARDLDRVREDPFAVMLTARMALQNNERFVVKGAGGGSSTAHGGFTSQHDNQRLLGEEEEQKHVQGQQGGGQQQVEVLPGVVANAEDLAVLAGMSAEERAAVMKKLRKMQKQAEEEQKVREAEAVLLAAGYDLGQLDRAGGSKRSKKDDKKKKSKKKKKKSKSRESKKDSKRHKGEEGKGSRKSGRRESESGSSSEGSDSSSSEGE